MRSVIKIFVLTIVFGFSLTPALLATNNVSNSDMRLCVSGNNIYGVYKATDGDWSGELTIKSDGTFVLVERYLKESRTLTGTFEIYDSSDKVSMIYFYINGSKFKGGFLVHSEQDGLFGITIDEKIFWKV